MAVRGREKENERTQEGQATPPTLGSGNAKAVASVQNSRTRHLGETIKMSVNP